MLDKISSWAFFDELEKLSYAPGKGPAWNPKARFTAMKSLTMKPNMMMERALKASKLRSSSGVGNALKKLLSRIR